MRKKSYIVFVLAIFLLNIMACKRAGDRSIIAYNMLKSEVQSGDTINDFEIDWERKERVVNSDLYNFDIQNVVRLIAFWKISLGL